MKLIGAMMFLALWAYFAFLGHWGGVILFGIIWLGFFGGNIKAAFGSLLGVGFCWLIVTTIMQGSAATAGMRSLGGTIGTVIVSFLITVWWWVIVPGLVLLFLVFLWKIREPLISGFLRVREMILHRLS